MKGIKISSTLMNAVTRCYAALIVGQSFNFFLTVTAHKYNQRQWNKKGWGRWHEKLEEMNVTYVWMRSKRFVTKNYEVNQHDKMQLELIFYCLILLSSLNFLRLRYMINIRYFFSFLELEHVSLILKIKILFQVAINRTRILSLKMIFYHSVISEKFKYFAVILIVESKNCSW